MFNLYAGSAFLECFYSREGAILWAASHLRRNILPKGELLLRSPKLNENVSLEVLQKALS